MTNDIQGFDGLVLGKKGENRRKTPTASPSPSFSYYASPIFSFPHIKPLTPTFIIKQQKMEEGIWKERNKEEVLFLGPISTRTWRWNTRITGWPVPWSGCLSMLMIICWRSGRRLWVIVIIILSAWNHGDDIHGYRNGCYKKNIFMDEKLWMEHIPR